jgi:ABC-2 type transport system permease protein
MANEPQTPPSFTPRRRWTVGFDMTIRTLLVLAVVVMTNYLAGKFFHREYLSAQTRTDLSPRTMNLVRAITNDVKVTVYYDRDDELFSTITAMLREYQALNPRIRVDVVDYLRDAAEAQRVKQAYKLPESQNSEEKNFVIFDAGNGHRVVNGNLLADRELVTDQKKGTYDRPVRAFKGEMFFTGMLFAVTNPKPLKAYVLQGHGEHNFGSGDELTGYLDFNSVLAQSMIKAEPLVLTGTNRVPADCDLLIVAGSRAPILDDGLEKIDQYLNEGGRMFALFNADSTQRPSGLERILSRWNVIVSLSCVQDAKNSRNTLRSAPGADVTIGAFSEHPAVKALFGYNLSLILPRPIVPGKATDNSPGAPRAALLFQTEPTATVVGDPKIKARSYPLAVAVERPALPGVTGRGATRMIVVGDSYFLANGPLKLLANRDFADYAVNWLVERTVLTEGLGARAMKDYHITLTVSQMTTIQWLLLGALPGGVLLFGGVVWLRRLK